MAVRVAKMNACRVAISTTSKRKKMTAMGSVTTPMAARPSRTTRPPPMKRMSRCPARMFAKSRTEREMIRTNCEITSIANRSGRIFGGVPAGIQLRK